MFSALRSRWRVIAATAVVTFLVTTWGTLALIRWRSESAPPAPELAPPRQITVTLFPMPPWDPEGSVRTEIPPAEFDPVMRLVAPHHYYGTPYIHESSHRSPRW